MSGMRGVELSRLVIERCREAGFAAAGVCSVEPSEREAELRAWLNAGKHGEMGWLAETAAIRARPALLMEGARSCVMVADLYASRADNAGEAELPVGRGRIARYARGRDYHKVIKKRLHRVADGLRREFPDADFVAFTDSAPAPERELASRAGLGWIGKHTLAIHPRLGSWFLLGGFATNLELHPPPEQEPVTDHCGTCTRCIEACPTDAITPYSVDATRCISYLTIERRSPIEERWFDGIGEWLFGCDICQEVCPHNSPKDPAWVGTEPNEAYGDLESGGLSGSFDLLEVLGWDTPARSKALERTAMKRATLTMWKRNALIVIGNELARLRDEAWSAKARARLEDIAADANEDDMVRETARAVLRRTGGSRASRG